MICSVEKERKIINFTFNTARQLRHNLLQNERIMYTSPIVQIFQKCSPAGGATMH